MRILKVKARKPDGLIVEFEKKNGEGKWNHYTMDCVEPPAPEVPRALADLAQDVTTLCELPEETLAMTVTGVSFSYGGEREIMGATIIARRNLQSANSPMNVLTPHKSVEPYAEGGHIDEKAIFDENVAGRLYVLHDSVVDYVNGKRLQISLFDGLTEGTVESGESDIAPEEATDEK
jgi:hypothetical protein